MHGRKHRRNKSARTVLKMSVINAYTEVMIMRVEIVFSIILIIFTTLGIGLGFAAGHISGVRDAKQVCEN